MQATYSHLLWVGTATSTECEVNVCVAGEYLPTELEGVVQGNAVSSRARLCINRQGGWV